ncbi:hypothetical protein SGPA1_60107 [Streptomyces misionensis JCM 4497]
MGGRRTRQVAARDPRLPADLHGRHPQPRLRRHDTLGRRHPDQDHPVPTRPGPRPPDGERPAPRRPLHHPHGVAGPGPEHPLDPHQPDPDDDPTPCNRDQFTVAVTTA